MDEPNSHDLGQHLADRAAVVANLTAGPELPAGDVLPDALAVVRATLDELEDHLRGRIAAG
jgi:hypothetical protein